MYKFQEVLFGAEERPSEEAPKEERIAAIVAAAEASLPANVLYPTAGSITEVDARTGRALEAIWLETAEIYGSEYAPELTYRESNPLCRGIYVFDRESEKDSYTVWDNSDGYALTAYASDHGVAVKAAHMVARNRIDPTSIAYGEMSTIQDVVHDLEMNAAQRIETRFKAALEQAVEDVKRDLIESAGSPQCDVDALSATALRLSALKSLSEMAENDSLPVDGMFIFLHAVGKLETAETPDISGRWPCASRMPPQGRCASTSSRSRRWPVIMNSGSRSSRRDSRDWRAPAARGLIWRALAAPMRQRRAAECGHCEYRGVIRHVQVREDHGPGRR